MSSNTDDVKDNAEIVDVPCVGEEQNQEQDLGDGEEFSFLDLSTGNSTPVIISNDSMLLNDVDDNNNPLDPQLQPEEALEVDIGSLLVNFSDGAELERLHRCFKNADISKPAEKLFKDPEDKICEDDSDEEISEDEQLVQIITIERCDPVTPRISGSEGKLTSVIATTTHTFPDPKTTTPQPIHNRPRPASFAGLSNQGARQLINKFFHKGRSKSDGTTLDKQAQTDGATSSGPWLVQKHKTFKKSQQKKSSEEEKTGVEVEEYQLQQCSKDAKPIFEEATKRRFFKLPPLKKLTKHKPSPKPTEDQSSATTAEDGAQIHKRESKWGQMGDVFRHAFHCVTDHTMK